RSTTSQEVGNSPSVAEPWSEPAAASCGSTRRQRWPFWVTRDPYPSGLLSGGSAQFQHTSPCWPSLGGRVCGTGGAGIGRCEVASFKMTGRRVFRMAPLHHHFEQKGWQEPTIVIRFWIIAWILAIAGLATLKLR